MRLPTSAHTAIYGGVLQENHRQQKAKNFEKSTGCENAANNDQHRRRGHGSDAHLPEISQYLRDPVLYRTYSVGRILGKGGFAWCYEITDVDDKSVYALKVASKNFLSRSHSRNKVLREIEIHYQLYHKNIVRLYSAFEDENNIYMVLEYCALQSLLHITKEQKVLSETEARFFLYQLLEGVRYLHENARILHRDLKLGNMLLTADLEVKIADFGLSTDMVAGENYQPGYFCGTPNYMAPEVLRKEGHSVASEAWAIGCIMYAMLIGKPPFDTQSLELTYSLISEVRYTYPVDAQPISSAGRDLIRLLLHPVSSQRPTAAQALNHQFFVGSIPLSVPCQQLHSPPVVLQKPRYFEASLINPIVIQPYAYMCPQKSTVCTVFAKPTISYHNCRSSTPSHAEPMLTAKGDAQRSLYKLSPNSFARKKQAVSFPSISIRGSDDKLSLASLEPCAFDASGSVSFGPDREAALVLWMQEYYQALADVLAQRPGSDTAPLNAWSSYSNKILYIVKWVDYSNRYGFGCQYNNDGISIMQNDCARLCMSGNRRYCRVWLSKGSSSGVGASKLYDMQHECSSIRHYCEVLHSFVDYMETYLVNGVNSDSSMCTSTSVPFIVLWRRLNECLIVVLSDGTFQINFLNEHTKVVLSRVKMTVDGAETHKMALTVVDASRQASTYPLTASLLSVLDASILKHTLQLLDIYVLMTDACFTDKR